MLMIDNSVYVYSNLIHSVYKGQLEFVLQHSLLHFILEIVKR